MGKKTKAEMSGADRKSPNGKKLSRKERKEGRLNLYSQPEHETERE